MLVGLINLYLLCEEVADYLSGEVRQNTPMTGDEAQTGENWRQNATGK